MEERNSIKLNILVSAFDFCPQESPGSYSLGGLLAWKIVEQLSQQYNISVITHTQNRDAVMEALDRGDLPQVSISFVDLPRMWRTLIKTEMGQSLVFYLWQKNAYQHARWQHQENRFDAAHHLTPWYDWIPSFIGAFLPVPFIWGPLGGGEKKLSLAQRWGRRSRVRKKCSERAESILVCNRETKELFPEKLWKKTQFFPWGGLSQAEFPEPKKRVQNPQPFRIITVSLDPHNQNLEQVLKAFQYFHKTHPDSQLQLLCQNSSRTEISGMVTKLGLENHVELIERIPRSGLRQIFRSGDIFVCLDTDEEGASLLIDAMSSGLPTVGLDQGASGVTIQAGWGKKLPADDPSQLFNDVALAFEQLYKDKVLRRKMGRAARKNVKEYYLWERLGQKLCDLYAEHFLQEESIHHSKQGEGRFFY